MYSGYGNSSSDQTLAGGINATLPGNLAVASPLSLQVRASWLGAVREIGPAHRLAAVHHLH
jgi:hypothetical protein